MSAKESSRFVAVLPLLVAVSCGGDSGGPCSTTADCAVTGWVCYDGLCRAACAYPGDCPLGETCRPLGVGFCSSSGSPCLTDPDCGGGEYCVPSGAGACVGGGGGLEVDSSAYRLHLGATSGGSALGGSCATLWACLCVPDPSNDLCWALSGGYYADAGCRAILAEGACSGGIDGPAACDPYDCDARCRSAGHLRGVCDMDACMCSDSGY